jgi:putative phage-type endonuclease
MDIELLTFGTREEWLAARQKGIGASESAALFDLSPWQSRFSLWAEKTGLAPPVELDGEWLEWGLLLEEPIAQRYAKRTQREVWQPGAHSQAIHPHLPFMRATPDRWVITAPDRDGRGVLQIKNASFFKADAWEMGPPDFVQAQVQHELAVTGFRWGSVAVLIGGNEFRYYDLDRNDAYIDELEHACAAFWQMVERREQPPVDGSRATAEALRRLHPLDDGSAVHLDDAALEAWAELERSKGALKALEAVKGEAENRLRAAIGGATFGLLPDGRLLSYKHITNNGYTRVVEPYTYRVLREEKQRAQKKGAKAA